MKRRDHSRLLADLAEAYTERSPRSAALHKEAKRHLVDGGSHAIRLGRPFPPRVVSATGAWIRDEDGHGILDFWQGHLANILGHNPEIVTSEVAKALEAGWGLQTGFCDRLQIEAADILCQRTGAEKVRFTTSGTLATMYAILLSCAHTGRDWVMKAGGGWHGGHPWGLKGVHYHAGNGFDDVESYGLPSDMTDRVLLTGFNDPQVLHDQFREHGDRISCLVLEPVCGAGGVLPATREYLQAAREVTSRHGSALVFDEVVTGFRFRAGDVGALYGVRPDLATFGKIIGGGMPVAAVAGRADLLELVGRSSDRRVAFSGGTFSAHPASLLAARTAMSHLVAHETDLYPRLAALGAATRQVLAHAFTQEGIYAQCTGHLEGVLPGSPLFMVHFPHRADAELLGPEDVFDPEVCDFRLSGETLQLALLLEDVFLFAAHGTVTAAHSEADIDTLRNACRKVAGRFKASLS